MKNVAEASRAVSVDRVGSVSCVSVADEMNSAVRQKLVRVHLTKEKLQLQALTRPL